jgi:acyl carrier protein
MKVVVAASPAARRLIADRAESVEQHMQDAVLSQIQRLLMNYSDGAIKDPSEVKVELPVFGPRGVVLDSLSVLDALCDIEKTFGIAVPDEDLTEELFASVGALASYIEAKVQSRTQSSGGV